MRALGEGLASGWDVEVVPVDSAPTELPEEVGLVVVGGATHAMGLTRRRTRADVARQGAPPATGATRGLREWLGEAARSAAVQR